MFLTAKEGPTACTDSEKEKLLDAWKKAALRAEEDFNRYKPVFMAYLSGKIDGDMFFEQASDVFYARMEEVRSLWDRLNDAINASPNIFGIGIDLKKLYE